MEPLIYELARKELGKKGIAFIAYDVLKSAGFFYSGHIMGKDRLRQLVYAKFSRNPKLPPLINIGEFKTWEIKTYSFQRGATPGDVLAFIFPRVGWACSRYYAAARKCGDVSGRRFAFGGFKRKEWRKQVMAQSRKFDDMRLEIAPRKISLRLVLTYSNEAYIKAGRFDINRATANSLKRYVKSLERRLKKSKL